MKAPISIVVAAFAACLFAHQTRAGEFDGTHPFICAPVEIASCGAGAACSAETAESINLPQFLVVNFDQKAITGKRPGGEALSTAILTRHRDEGRLVLQGTENGLSWTLSVHEDDGRMTIVAAGDQLAFMAFGACIRP
jgi:hypothetical protein